MGFPYVLAVTLFTWFALTLSRYGLKGDALMDIAIGRFILAHHTVPARNLFTAAAYGAPWSDSEWLFQLYVAALDHAFGHTGVFLGLLPPLALLAATLAGLVAEYPSARAALLALYAAYGAAAGVHPRPQLFSYGFFAYGLFALARQRRSEQEPGAEARARLHLWLFALTTVLWTNLHASAFLAPGLLGLELLARGVDGRRPKALLGPFLLSTLGLWVRPGGVAALLGFVASVVRPGVVGVIPEWSPLSAGTLLGVVALPAVVGSLLLGVSLLRRSGDAASFALGLASAGASLLATRFIPYTALVLVALWARERDVLPRLAPEAKNPVLEPLLLFLAVLLALLALEGPGGLFPLRVSHGAQEATRWLRARGAWGVLAAEGDGRLLEYEGVVPFADTRAELFDRAPWWGAYLSASRSLPALCRFRAGMATQGKGRFVFWPKEIPKAPRGCLLVWEKEGAVLLWQSASPSPRPRR